MRLFEAVEQAGGDLGLRFYGGRALMSTRLEKNWGVWTMDFRPDFDASESGLDAFIDWNKDFVGKEAAAFLKHPGWRSRHQCRLSQRPHKAFRAVHLFPPQGVHPTSRFVKERRASQR
ncbi:MULTISPECIES: hypothetical protein [unclassified Mesorhizobium]|uniref:hypothetical protein n=1 Tax=unclassified Mesorhizobium TaxID=325217 RepID=UPI003339B091